MSDPNTTTGINDAHNKTEEVQVTCDILWSAAQNFCYLRLSDRTAEGEYELIGLYEARAKRIAATYARFYLETEEGGDRSKMGRYYWMALGAFASKTVACLLGKWRVQLIATIENGLGKGNLWLFMDIAAPHWFYNHYPENFGQGMVCRDQRSATALVNEVKAIVDDMPWSAESLGKINQLAISGDLKTAFDFLPRIELTMEDDKRKGLQMDHLMAVARHEQGAVLQPLIYDDPEFGAWAKRQRWPVFKQSSPAYEITFTHRCSIRDAELKSVAPDDLIVEDYDSRMKWIDKAAQKFHGLMIEQENYMIGELNTIASWRNTPDA